MFRCKICGYLYDSNAGDPMHGIDPGIPFDELPYSWVCPICGVTKDDFVEVD